MIASDVHWFDSVLCDYLRGNIGGLLLHDPGERDFAKWMGKALPRELLAYIRKPTEPRLVFNEVELDTLACATEWLPNEGSARWTPWPGAHREYLECLPAIRQLLSGATAEEFASASVEFARQLGTANLGLHEGIVLVTEWIEHVRRLKQALGMLQFLPRPEGQFPTPTHPLKPGESMPDAEASVEPENLTGASAQEPSNPVLAAQFADDDLLSPKTLAQFLRVSSAQVIGFIQDGQLDATNVGRGRQKPRYRVRFAALREFMLQHQIPATATPPAKQHRRRPAILEKVVDHFA